MTILTQQEMDSIKSKPVNEQVLFLLDLFNEGQETLNANKEIIGENMKKVFHFTVVEIMTASLETAADAMTNPQIENFTDEQGKEYIKNKIVNNVVDKMTLENI
jgi:flagellin-specific chaperone FliS